MNIDNMPAYKFVQGWQNFIDECVEGYHWDMSEYHLEIKVRDFLQIKIDKGELDLTLLEKAKSLDEKFKSLLQEGLNLPNEIYWWRKGVLKQAGEPYCYYMASTHNIYVLNVDE